MRVRLIVQYLGTAYSGWQVQSGYTTIQQKLEEAIESATGEYCETFASGRTDAGVHAWAQVVHFDTNTRIDATKLAYAINRYLPSDISVIRSDKVSDDFNARFDVKQKTYEYYFYCSIVDLPLLATTFAKVRTEFDYERACKNIQCFVGTHDFVGFCSARTQSSSTVRTIFDIQLLDLGDRKYCLRVTGNGFLYNMVRIIAGTIIEIGCGKIDADKLPDIIASGDRNLAGRTAPPNGLVLKEVVY